MHFLFKWSWEILSPLAGLFFTLSFAPYNYNYLVVVSLVFIFLSWHDVSPARAALRAYLFGLGMFGSGIYWVYISIHDYGGAPTAGAILLTLLVICFWSIFPAITSYISVKISHKTQNKLVWFIPFIWILIEYFRGYWFLNGFPWLQIAYSQLHTPLAGFVPIVGVYGTGFLLAISASAIVAGIQKTIRYKIVIISLISLWTTGYILQGTQWTHAIGKEIKVSLVQGNISQDQKWLPKNKIKTLLEYQELTRQNWASDIIIWPETAIPAYLTQVQEFYLTPLSEEAKKHNTDLIVSLPTRDKEKNYYNTVITLGQNQARYNKNHLLPFGEYLPLQPLSGFILDSLNLHLGTFTSGGSKQKLLIAGGYPFATSICYEDAFANEAINALPEAAFLVNVTNDAWFGDSTEPHQHMQIAQMRALETGRYLLRTTNTGITAIVDPNGFIIKKSPQFKQVVLNGTIFPMAGMTPYAKLGDGIIMIVLLLCFATLFIHTKMRNRDHSKQ